MDQQIQEQMGCTNSENGYRENEATSKLVRNHTNKIKALKKDRDQQIKDIQLEFSTNIAELKVRVDKKRQTLRKNILINCLNS